MSFTRTWRRLLQIELGVHVLRAEGHHAPHPNILPNFYAIEFSRFCGQGMEAMASIAALSELEDAIREGDALAVQRTLTSSKLLKIDINTPRADTGNTLLHRAVEKATLEPVISLLLAAGARVNIANNNGATPLHRAVRAGHEAIATILVKHRAVSTQRRLKPWADSGNPLAPPCAWPYASLL